MSISKVTRNFQVTIPASIRQALHVKVGSLIDFVVQKGQVILQPKMLIDEDQSWFWTEEWQKGEREADEDIRKGRVTKTKNIQELFKKLDH